MENKIVYYIQAIPLSDKNAHYRIGVASSLVNCQKMIEDYFDEDLISIKPSDSYSEDRYYFDVDTKEEGKFLCICYTFIIDEL
jgi:hypothetical protein